MNERRGGNGSWDVLVVGAGMAGLGCARALAEAGLRVCVLEAEGRVGGRVRTERVGDAVVELGAEFVHGRPEELLALIKEAGLTLVERGGVDVSFEDGHLVEEADEEEEGRFAPLERLRVFRGEDVSFRAWLDGSEWATDEEVREGALGYVEGFNAADATVISARSLGVQQEAEDASEGERLAHVSEGYDRVAEFLTERVRAQGGEVRCGVRVEAVHWGVGRAALETNEGEFAAPKVVLTLPLGVVQAGDVRIVPEPVTILRAAGRMRMGEVCRFSMVFRTRWWEGMEPQPAMRELSFLFDFEELPSVWWTAHPEQTAVLTGWVGGPRARGLLAMTEEQLTEIAVRQVARLFGVDEERVRTEMVALRTHDWSADVGTRGSYSYVAVGGLDASARMSEPVEQTLYFAGEHTDTSGHWGTVHGALRSGLRAARQVLGR